jgi:hypothetical protein
MSGLETEGLNKRKERKWRIYERVNAGGRYEGK